MSPPARTVYIVGGYGGPEQVFETRGAAIDYLRIALKDSDMYSVVELPLLERWPLLPRAREPGSGAYLFDKPDGEEA